jgi:hypothetical protein
MAASATHTTGARQGCQDDFSEQAAMNRLQKTSVTDHAAILPDG